MAEAVARVAKSWDICTDGTARSGFFTEVFLYDIIGMDSVLRPHVKVKVHGPLVQRNVSEGATGETIEGIRVRSRSASDGVGRGNQGEQTVYSGGSDSGAVIDARNCAGDRQALMLAQTLIGEKDEGLIPLYRPSKIGAKLVTVERGLWRRHRVEKVASIEIIVADKFKEFPVIGIGAGACGHVDDGAGIAAVFRRKSRVVNFEFGERVNRRLKRNLVLNWIVQIDAVDQPVGGVLALARRIDTEGALSSKRS